jgi:hypothetical protein
LSSLCKYSPQSLVVDVYPTIQFQLILAYFFLCHVSCLSSPFSITSVAHLLTVCPKCLKYQIIYQFHFCPLHVFKVAVHGPLHNCHQGLPFAISSLLNISVSGFLALFILGFICHFSGANPPTFLSWSISLWFPTDLKMSSFFTHTWLTHCLHYQILDENSFDLEIKISPWNFVIYLPGSRETLWFLSLSLGDLFLSI